ncbi:outer membrane beta-barrel protein [Mangrovibacterium lignilyticum]|uniref:outer membrane beta-barrel protein n=1 Tax=Mangrovibacterium lignilyticum TaxID=2668052 RepID=UPI0013D0BC44|nr:outer membrane beta-barrel protein [Mangrovibacterium lignilyticum]
MKKYFILLSILTVPFLGFSQSRFFVNLNAGWDYSANKYYNYNNYDIFENEGNDLSWGLDLGYKFSDIVRFRIESRFGQYSFGQYYSGADLIQTEMTMSYFNINPRFDFRVWTKDKFELFVSPGLKLEYIYDSDQVTDKTDGTTSDLSYVSSAYADNMAGFIGGAIFKYNINKHLGITLSPEYTLYFKKLYEKNDDNMRRFSARLGVEWNF